MVLGVYGASGLGREVRVLAEKVNAFSKRWDKVVFIDDNEEIKSVQGVEVLSLSDAKAAYSDLEAVIAIGEPAVRGMLYEKLCKEGVALATIIYPDTYIDDGARIGRGSVIGEYAVLSSCVIEENVFIHPHAVIGHDTVIRKHSMIGGNCVVSGNCQVGERSYMGFLSGLKQGIKIGNDAICSAGAMVFRDVEDDMIVVGNPGRVVRRNENKRVFS